MGLLSFLKRTTGNSPDSAANATTKANSKAKANAKVPPVAESPDTVAQARTRARQRLIGAVVLVGAGVIGFPLLFETQPRPLPVDTPIEIARRDAPPSVPATRTTPAARTPAPVPPSVITETPAEAGLEVAAASAPLSA